MNRRQLLGALALVPATAFAQALPPPRHGRPNLVRIAGTRALAPVVAVWARAFAAEFPAIRVETAMTGSDVAMAGLYTATTDIALIGRDATKPEIQAFEWIYRFRPRGIPVLAGSVATPGCSPAVAVMVHANNPLVGLTLDQLRAVLADEQPRVRTWGELGLSGPWRQRPINLYMPHAESGTGRFLRERVLNGSNRLAWERMREFAVPPGPPAADAKAAQLLWRALARDPFGLAIGVAGNGRGFRTVALAGKDGVPRLPDARSVAAEEYPLSRKVNGYFAHPPITPGHAETFAFLGFTLTERAQALAAGASDYLALPTTAVSSARALLN